MVCHCGMDLKHLIFTYCISPRIRVVTDPKDCTVTTTSKVQLPPSALNHHQNLHQAHPTTGNPPSGSSASCVLYDLSVDGDGRLAATVGQDGILRLYDVESGTPAGVIRQALEAASDGGDGRGTRGNGGEAVRVLMDPSGTLVVCACADGSVVVYDLKGGGVAARSGGGHGGAATAVVIADDCQR